MKIKKEIVLLDEKIDQISNDLLFHPHPVIENLFLDYSTVCSLLEIHPSTLWRYRTKGLIQSHRIGGTSVYKLFDIDTLAKFIALRKLSACISEKL